MTYTSCLKGIRTSLIIFSVNLLVGCTKPVSTYYPPDPNKPDNKTVYIVNHGIHTGIVLPKRDATPYLHSFNDFKSALYLEIGLGDETYYQSEVNTLWMGIKALFWPTNSVLHVASLQKEPVSYFSNKDVVQLQLSKTGFIRLVDFIDKSFALDEKRQIIRLGSGLYGTSRFYRAKGKFHLFNNCNTWSASAIRSSGFPINAFNVFTADDIMYQLKQNKYR